MAVPVAIAASFAVGCHAFSSHTSVAERRRADVAMVTCSDIPRELEMASTAPYRVAPPDILLIETVRDLRPPDSPLLPGDELILRATNTLPFDPEGTELENALRVVGGAYAVEASGHVDLGPEYGKVDVAGLTTAQSEAAITKHLVEVVGLKEPRVSVTLGTPNAPQPINGEHLVGPDGTINLGLYGSVYVAGLTVEEVRATVGEHLRRYVQDPLVRVDVLGFNSKKIYVISDGGGFGERVIPLPHTGNETVLDAIAQIQGLSEVSSKSMWVARPSPAGTGIAQTLPIDWRGITQDGVTATNYQLYPGDRIYIKADNLITLDNFISKVLSPVERVFGTILLGSGVVQRLESGGGAGGGGFGLGGF